MSWFARIGYENCDELIAAADALTSQKRPSIHTIIMAVKLANLYNGFDRVGLNSVTAAQFRAAFEERLAFYQG